MKKVLLFTLVLALVMAMAGCVDGTPDSPTTPTTTVTTTTTTAPQQAEPALQIGGATFRLDGVTFKMGESPDKLLAHLGEPNEIQYGCESVYGYIWVTYYYDRLVVQTFSPHEPANRTPLPEEATDQILADIYFTDAHYSFDGISVGDTAAKLDEKVTANLKTSFQGYHGMGLYGGPCYRYDQDLESAGNADRTNWYVFFFEDDRERMEENDNNALPDMKIKYIKIGYAYYPL